MTDYPTLALNDGRQIPQLGFGTWQIENDQAAEAVKTALDVGYWLVDTAAIYRNERGVGDGIGDWSDLFLQTKIWNEACGDAAEALGPFNTWMAKQKAGVAAQEMAGMRRFWWKTGMEALEGAMLSI